MARFLKSRAKAKGAAPGSLIFMGNQKMDEVKINLIKYSKDALIEKSYDTIESALENIDNDHIDWLNIDGIHDTSIINKVGQHFKISPLALENILNTGQRTKLFEDNDSVTVISKAIYFNSEENKISVEQISFILFKNTLISFQEKTGDHFSFVRDRIRKNIGKIRRSCADYLLYALLDSLVDNYLIILEQLGEKIETLEKSLSNPSDEVSKKLFQFRTEVSYFRKTIKPLREVLTRILRSKNELILEEDLIYYQELFDLEEQAVDAIDNYFGMTNDLINLYNTNLSNKANEVMKFLTIFASIFIPLTFIAGIYGTNFEYVPELHFRNAYFIMWGVMIVIAIGMLYYFKRNKWF